MNYKNIIRNRNFRVRLIRLFDFVSDAWMLRFQYYVATGRHLDLKNPKRYTEKLQWYKLNCRNDFMTKCSDKYEVRAYVADKGLEHLLVPLIDVYNTVDEIDFNRLPKRFVLKTTNGSHTNILCKDKEHLDIGEVKKNLKEWLKYWGGMLGREWSYYNIRPRIICETFLEGDANGNLLDYKFLCFNGKAAYLYVASDRDSSFGASFSTYDRDFKPVDVSYPGFMSIKTDMPKPVGYEKMVEIAEKLAEGFPFVRVDLYNVDGVIYFGELTFYDSSGYFSFDPDGFDYLIGEQFILK